MHASKYHARVLSFCNRYEYRTNYVPRLVRSGAEDFETSGLKLRDPEHPLLPHPAKQRLLVLDGSILRPFFVLEKCFLAATCLWIAFNNAH